MRSVHRLRQAHSLLHQSLAPRIASSSSSALASVAVAPAAASFHSSSLASFAAPAAAGKAAGGAASAAANIPPPEGSTRWLKEGWGAPRLVPSVTAEAKVNADGLVVDQAASDAAEAADRFTLPVLHAEVREHVGSRYSRYLRQQRMRIPGIICDRSNPRQNQLLISLDRFELEKLARQYRRTLTHKVCLIKIEGQEPIKVIADELQRHAVTDELLVANWFLFKPNREQVRIKMPIVYTGTEECIGVKRGGSDQQRTHARDGRKKKHACGCVKEARVRKGAHFLCAASPSAVSLSSSATTFRACGPVTSTCRRSSTST